MGCPCDICKNGYEYGAFILDALSADYLCEMEATRNREGDPLMYFDTIEQRNTFEQLLKEHLITYDGPIERCIEGLVERVGIEDASSIVLFKKIAKNYLNIQNIANEKSK
jgi:hypothetical protein